MKHSDTSAIRSARGHRMGKGKHRKTYGFFFRMLCISIVVSGLSNNATADPLVETKISVILPPEMNRPIKGKPLYFQMELSNNGQTPVRFESYRVMGLEHLAQADDIALSEKVSSLYLDRVKITFTHLRTGKTILETAYFPFSGTIESGKKVEVIFAVNAPEGEGPYSITSEYIRDEREGNVINLPGEEFKAKFKVQDAKIEKLTITDSD